MEQLKVTTCEQCATDHGIIIRDRKSGLMLCEFCKEDLDGILLEKSYSVRKKTRSLED